MQKSSIDHLHSASHSERTETLADLRRQLARLGARTAYAPFNRHLSLDLDWHIVAIGRMEGA
jgi:hypothetical protein